MLLGYHSVKFGQQTNWIRVTFLDSLGSIDYRYVFGFCRSSGCLLTKIYKTTCLTSRFILLAPAMHWMPEGRKKTLLLFSGAILAFWGQRRGKMADRWALWAMHACDMLLRYIHRWLHSETIGWGRSDLTATTWEIRCSLQADWYRKIRLQRLAAETFCSLKWIFHSKRMCETHDG